MPAPPFGGAQLTVAHSLTNYMHGVARDQMLALGTLAATAAHSVPGGRGCRLLGGPSSCSLWRLFSSHSAPPEDSPLMRHFAGQLRACEVFPRTERVAVALSGGPDSLALAALTSRWWERSRAQVSHASFVFACAAGVGAAAGLGVAGPPQSTRALPACSTPPLP